MEQEIVVGLSVPKWWILVPGKGYIIKVILYWLTHKTHNNGY